MCRTNAVRVFHSASTRSAALDLSHRPDDAAEANVAGRGIDRLREAGGWTVAPAVVGRAEMRAPLQNLARNRNLRRVWVVADVGTRAARVHRDAARLWGVSRMSWLIPIAGPLPHVADHVMQSVAVGRIHAHRRRGLVTVLV